MPAMLTSFFRPPSISRTPTRTPGRAKGWRRWRVIAPRAGTGTSGCPTSASRSAEPASRRAAPERGGGGKKKTTLKPQGDGGETSSSSTKPTQTPADSSFFLFQTGEERREQPGRTGGRGKGERCQRGTRAGAVPRSRAGPRGRAEEPREEDEGFFLVFFFYFFGIRDSRDGGLWMEGWIR